MVDPLLAIVPPQEDVSPSAVHRPTTRETAAGGGSAYGVRGRGGRTPGRGRVGQTARGAEEVECQAEVQAEEDEEMEIL